MVEAFREGQQSEIPRGTEGELPESKIFDLLSAVGNRENKALELIVMREGVIYSRNALWHEVMNHQGDRGWGMDEKLPFKHCELSLSPIGLVTREALRPDGSAWGYQITEYGLRTGIPFAGILLKWSHEHPGFSLYRMFGSTQSTSIRDEQSLEKKRAQETRYKIFWEIVTNPSSRIRLTDIADELNEDLGLIGLHISSLGKNGVIFYDVTEKGKSYSHFKRAEIVPDKVPEQYRKLRTLTVRVWNLLSQSIESEPSKYLSVEDTVNTLIKQYPEYENLQKRSFTISVICVLSDLEKQGYLQREKFKKSFQSELTLSEEQREATLSLVTLIDKFKSGDRQTIEEGRRFAQRVANDPKLFSELMLKAREASPNANSTSREDMSSTLISILQGHPNHMTNQIQQYLERDYDKRLSADQLRNNLSALVKEEKVVLEKTKSGNVYRLVEEESQTPSLTP